MTQTLHAVGGADSKKQRAESNILHVAKVLFTYANLDKEELGTIIDVSRATAYQRWNGRSAFKAGELALLAEHFGVPAEVFLSGPQSLDLAKVALKTRITGGLTATNAASMGSLQQVAA